MREIIKSLPSKQEIESRIKKLFLEINNQKTNWSAAFIVNKVNQYYLTGTLQDGVFVLKKDGEYAYFARRSYERAKIECIINNVYPMTSYKDILNFTGSAIQEIYTETETITYAMLERIKKYFKGIQILSADKILTKLRSVKSEYELSCMEESGRQHNYLLESIVPGLLRDGMSEVDLTAEIYEKMLKLGHHGISRFAMHQADIIIGQLGFGTNSLYPTNFDGPGGMKGMHPAAPIIGERERRLKKGDLVFVDIGYGINGYHTDRTQIYMFGSNPSDEVDEIHNECLKIQKQTAALLTPGNIPSQIYDTIINGLSKDFLQNFMGFKDRKVKFLGHGIGLQVDELPIIANGFTDPLEENTVLAIEPKKGVDGIGLVGVEDTYIITKNGGKCITCGEKGIISVGI